MTDITLDGKSLSAEEGLRIKDLSVFSDRKVQICGAFVNNMIKSLNYRVKDGDIVRLIDITQEAGFRIYESTLLLLLEYAVHSLFPDKKLTAGYSLGGGVFCEFAGEEMSEEDVRLIKEKMQSVSAENLKINEITLPLQEARNIAESGSFLSSVELLEYFRSENITLYEMAGCYCYFHSKTLSSSEEAGVFSLVRCSPGCVLLGPRKDSPSEAREMTVQDNLHEELQSYEKWCSRLDVSDAVSLNRKIENGSITNLITIAESRHEQLIAKMASEIFEARESKRVILIAGPSCAGKTTTSKRLRNHLEALGISSLAIGIDDYFLNREDTPLDEEGNYDYESLRAVDVELFNEHLLLLMNGFEAGLPKFDFISGTRSSKKTYVRAEKSCPIIIEGIHGLNEKLTPHIPKENKYKIYINDLTHLNLDQLNRIPTSDVRLVRRIVRDKVQRGHDALSTIKMWQSVRRGEEQNIYPFSSEADFVFNSSLLYEMGVLKKYAEPALSEISSGSEYYHEALRLLDFLSFFLPVEDESAVYTNSILREFIGGNVFDSL